MMSSRHHPTQTKNLTIQIMENKERLSTQNEHYLYPNMDSHQYIFNRLRRLKCEVGLRPKQRTLILAWGCKHPTSRKLATLN